MNGGLHPEEVPIHTPSGTAMTVASRNPTVIRYTETPVSVHSWPFSACFTSLDATSGERAGTAGWPGRTRSPPPRRQQQHEGRGSDRGVLPPPDRFAQVSPRRRVGVLPSGQVLRISDLRKVHVPGDDACALGCLQPIGSVSLRNALVNSAAFSLAP